MFEKDTFEVKEDHLKLLRNAYVWWDDAEFGAPGINPKRPYGNSYVIEDIAKILGISDNKRHEDDEPYYLPEDEARMNQLHKETEIVLQIILATGIFETGVYECGKYTRNWVKAG